MDASPSSRLSCLLGNNIASNVNKILQVFKTIPTSKNAIDLRVIALYGNHYIWMWVVQHYFAKDSIVLGGFTYYPSRGEQRTSKDNPYARYLKFSSGLPLIATLWSSLLFYASFIVAKLLCIGQAMEKGGQTLIFFPKMAVNKHIVAGFLTVISSKQS